MSFASFRVLHACPGDTASSSVRSILGLCIQAANGAGGFWLLGTEFPPASNQWLVGGSWAGFELEICSGKALSHFQSLELYFPCHPKEACSRNDERHVCKESSLPAYSPEHFYSAMGRGAGTYTHGQTLVLERRVLPGG